MPADVFKDVYERALRRTIQGNHEREGGLIQHMKDAHEIHHQAIRALENAIDAAPIVISGEVGAFQTPAERERWIRDTFPNRPDKASMDEEIEVDLAEAAYGIVRPRGAA